MIITKNAMAEIAVDRGFIGSGRLSKKSKNLSTFL